MHIDTGYIVNATPKILVNLFETLHFILLRFEHNFIMHDVWLYFSMIIYFFSNDDCAIVYCIDRILCWI